MKRFGSTSSSRWQRKLRQGSAAEARRLALIEFGGVESARARCDRVRPGISLGTVVEDVRYGLRGILTHRWFSAAVIVTLALGIGLNTMVFTLVYAALFKPVPVHGGERLVSIQNRSLAQSNGGLPMSYPDFEDYRSQSTGIFEFFEAASDDGGILSENGLPPQQYPMQHATAGIFSMIHAKALLGRTFLPVDGLPGAAPVVVISYNIWQERYAGLPDVIGRQIRVNGLPATMIGVMPDGFHYPNNTDVWVPLKPASDLAKRERRTLNVYAILKPGMKIGSASAALNAITERLASQFPEDKELGVSVLTFQQRFNGGPIRSVFLLMLGAVGFVLLIACADVANMMLSRALGRQREMSIRTALGATRWRIVRQLLIESVLLSVAGGVAGLGLAAAGVHWFDLSTSTIRPYWIEFTMDYPVFGYIASLSILTGLLFGIAPALRSSKTDLMDVLKESSHNVQGRRGGWLSGGLVVFQFAFTLVLLTGAGIFVRSLFRSLTANPSVPAAQLTTARTMLPDSRYKDSDARIRFYDELLPRLRAIPGVLHASVTSDPPGTDAARQQIELEQAPIANPSKRPWVSLVAESPGYFETIHLPLLRGREFNQEDGTAHHEVAVATRDAAARLWPEQDPIGKRFHLFDDKNVPTQWITVVGVSSDIVQELQNSDPRPLLFVPYRQEGWNNAALVVESAADPVESMRKAVATVDPELPLAGPSRLDKMIERRTWFLSLFGKIFFGLALIAMLMASVGIYAVIAHATSSRTQEIGVRIALGATMRSILLMVMKRGLLQVAVGLFLGLGMALPAARLMASLQAFGVLHPDTGILSAVAVALASVGAFACWLPARRAVGLDPVKAIRYE
jgi:predicted permease